MTSISQIEESWAEKTGHRHEVCWKRFLSVSGRVEMAEIGGDWRSLAVLGGEGRTWTVPGGLEEEFWDLERHKRRGFSRGLKEDHLILSYHPEYHMV